MNQLSNFFIKMIEANQVPGPYRFGPFTDTLLAMVKKTGAKYEAYYKEANGKITLVRSIPKDINMVSIIMAPYLADQVGKSPFAKAEAEYMFKKIEKSLSKDQYDHGIKMITSYDEFTEEERKQYNYYKTLFLKMKK